MADPETRYEYGLTPEETAPGLLGLFNFLKGPVVDAFTPERREVIAPSKTTYQEIDGYAYPTTTPGEYGPPESGLEYMPVVQGAKSAYDFAGKFFSDGKFREQTGSALAKGIEQLFSDYMHAASQGGETTYDPVEKRERTLDPLLPLGMGMSASVVAPVKAGSSMVAGMFAGRNAQTADLSKLKVAEKMAEKGRSRDEIWDQTGWFKFKDRDGNPMGEWKFEVDDSLSRAVSDPAALKPYLTKTGRVKKGAGKTGYGPEIDKLLIHDELYKTYPGKTLEPVIDSLQDITRQRAVLKKELLELKKRDLSTKDYLAELGRLEDADAELIRKLIYALPATAKPGGPAKTARERYPLLDRPVGDTVVERTTPGGNLEGGTFGYYKPGLNTIAVRRQPDLYPITAQPSLSSEYLDAYFKATDAFKDAGFTLLADVSEGKVKYRVRISSLGPEGEVVIDSLPDNLKKQLDQLQDNTPKQLRDMSLESFHSTALHELQHAIQQREGFETGGDTSFFKGINRPINPKTGKQLTPYETYQALVGETEARLVQDRRNMDLGQRRFIPPYSQVDESMMYTRKDLGVERKAAGGFVTKPLYDDARIGGMI